VSDADEVRGVAERRAQALADQDWETLEAQLHREFVYVTAQGGRLDRDGYVAFVRDGPLRWEEQRLEEVQVTETGGVAVLTATVHDRLLVDGERHALTFVTTQTYVRDAGGWRYLAGHTALKP
jgi:ketosteroid isomerase-like protein